jgi:SAM-dependent methyltransferase
MSSTVANSYDVVPYTSHPISQSHPARMATIATLFSLAAPAVTTARVLELGCAAGGNIIPLAYDYPAGRFVGVDSSAVQLDEGRRLISELGLTNIELRQADILEVDATWGEFDYLICHGVYSWVPPHVQDKILSILAELLTPDGIAYVSYNTYPGWHLRGIVRDMMRYHAMRYDDPQERVAEARRVLDVVAKHSIRQTEAFYSTMLEHESAFLHDRGDHYIYHDHLEEHCEPFYFHEFVRRARHKGLDYLGEARLATMASTNSSFAEEVALSSLAQDRIAREQYFDYICNRTFRETLLHRAGRTPSSVIPSRVLWPMFVASGLCPAGLPVDCAIGAPATFCTRGGEKLTIETPLLKAALLELSEHWPEAVPFEQLLRAATSRLDIVATDLQRTWLAQAILAFLTTSNLIEISVEPSQFTIAPGNKPVASLLARHQAAMSKRVTNRRHKSCELSDAQHKVVQALDGSRSASDMARHLELPDDVAQDQIAQLAKLALIVN